MNNDQQRDMTSSDANRNAQDVPHNTPRKNAGQFQKGSERAREAGRKGGRASR